MQGLIPATCVYQHIYYIYIYTHTYTYVRTCCFSLVADFFAYASDLGTSKLYLSPHTYLCNPFALVSLASL